MNSYIRTTVASVFIFLAPACHAYKIETHDELSQNTVLCSAMGQEAFAKSIGWVSIENDDDKYHSFKRIDLINKTGSTINLTSQELVGWGAVYEDEETKLRPVNHFFNPLTSEGGSAGLASRQQLIRVKEKNTGVSFFKPWEWLSTTSRTCHSLSTFATITTVMVILTASVAMAFITRVITKNTQIKTGSKYLIATTAAATHNLI